MPDPNYLSKQAKIVNNEELPENNRKDAGWRFLSNCNDNSINPDGSLTDDEWKIIKTIAKEWEK